MNFLRLLGQPLKSNDVIEVLEHFDMTVTYDFDRLHEGTRDQFWSQSKPNGFQFRFNEVQILDVIFLYTVARSGFTPTSLAATDVPSFASMDEARSAFERSGQSFKAGDGYVKVFGQSHSIHYEFRNDALALVTLALNKS